MFSILHGPFYIPTYSLPGFKFVHISPTCIILFLDNSHLNRRWVISHCSLICISLIINDAEYLFIYLLTIRMSSLEKYLSKSFAFF